MTRTETVMLALLASATELAEARRHDSDTCEEWDALERAITAAEESMEPTYAFDGDRFVRRSRHGDIGNNEDGSERVDAVDAEDVEIIAQSIEEDVDPHGNGWFVVDELVAPSCRTWTRCLVAIEFMKREGLVRQRGLDNRLTVTGEFSAREAVERFKLRCATA